MIGLCPQCEKKYREEQRTSLLAYMKENATDENLSPDLRQQCADWIKASEFREGKTP